MATTNYLRILEPGKHAIFNPATGLHEVPDPSVQYTSDHPLVQAAPWAFGSESDLAEAQRARMAVRSVPVGDVEQATHAPGERRSVHVPRKAAKKAVAPAEAGADGQQTDQSQE